MESITQTNLLNSAQAAEYLPVKATTLAVWRSDSGNHLLDMKVGCREHYRFSSLNFLFAERAHLYTSC